MSFAIDQRVVLILDAGGTNFVFSAMKGEKLIAESVCLPAYADQLDACLNALVTGFQTVIGRIHEKPVAISFAFPGPADYTQGIISNALPNFPAFNTLEGFPLKDYLEEIFNIPVFINNDGDLYAFGEACFGFLPQVNKMLKDSGSSKQYKNLIGLTLGTGFGAGIVIDGKLLLGDNSCASEVFPLRNKEYPEWFVEESISIRGLQRMYWEDAKSAPPLDTKDLTPKDIYDIAEGVRDGDQKAAIYTFERFGTIVGDAIATLVTLIDGVVVIGGGLAGAAKYFMPYILAELNGTISKADGSPIPRIPQTVYNLDDESSKLNFLTTQPISLATQKGRTILYEKKRKVGIGISQIGAVDAIMKGAYSFALSSLNDKVINESL